ncbi:hypothetical protein EI94DRAFT_1774184 [Lactarius quietus]|nr:hypothetical protein EI94DRAFT_1774184 [Lactarius quietus]
MSTLCEGCRTIVKCSGLYSHFHQSRNPLCELYQVSLDGGTLSPDGDEDITPVPTGSSGAQEIKTLLVQVWPTAGGDRSESDFDAGTGKADDLEDIVGRYIEEEDDFDEEAMVIEASLAEYEYRLEPQRPLVSLTIESNNCEDSPEEPNCPYRLQGGYEQPLNNEPFIVKFPGRAGCSCTINNLDVDSATGANTYQFQVLDEGTTNVYAPFLSKTDWEIARWAKLRGPGSTAFSELTSIKGLGLSFKNTRSLDSIINKSLPGRPRFQRHVVTVGSEVCEVFYRDVIDCIRYLFGDPTFMPHLCFVPERHYTDHMKDTRMYHDMHAGKWWWSTQEVVENEQPGATIVPVLLSSDKTLLTTFRNKSAYPLYLTIGNIPKEICRKPSLHTYILLTYLPTTHLVHVSNRAQCRCLLTNLYHSCMHRILVPLESVGSTGMPMMCGNGRIYRNHPIFAAFIGDYPKWILTTGSITGECPTCDVDHDRLRDYDSRDNNQLRDLALDPAGFLHSCSLAGIKPIAHPFWKDLPYAHIFHSITPDILHQIHQAWIIGAIGANEVDARCCRLPPNHNLRAFTKGISTLSHVTGQEHNQMGHILLTLVMDIPLAEGHSNACLQRAIHALLDFVFLAQYPIHTVKALELLEDAFIFVDIGIRRNFDIPKLHFLSHYVDLIKLYSTTDNFNTETTEQLHIDLTKDAFNATNKKDEGGQMTNYVEWKEKIHRHEHVIGWWLEGSPPIMAAPHEWLPPGLKLDHDLHMSNTPSDLKVSLETIKTDYGAEHFRVALRCYVVRTNSPHLTTAQVECSLWDTVDSIHAYPHRSDALDRTIPARFDTAIINEGTGGDTGVNGYHIGHIRVVFRLPEKSLRTLFRIEDNTPKHLVYVKWYMAFSQNLDPDNLLFKITPQRNRDGGRMCSIIPLANIQRSVHLIPKFGPVAPQEWKSSTVLDLANVFFVNSFTDSHLYCILC